MFRVPIRPDVELRILEERHAPALFAVIDQNREFLRQWLPFIEATQVEDDTLSFIRASLEQFAANQGFAAGIWVSGELCGVIGTRKIDWMNRRVEVGYWIAEAYQGRGIMTDCCRAVVDYLFAELDLHRVEIQCATGNDRSCAIPKKLGFALEGTRRQAELLNGIHLDLLLFARLKTDSGN